MAQNALTVVNGSGYAVRTGFNLAVQAVTTMFAGASDPATMSPSNAFAYMLWIDTQNNLVKQRNAANNAWVAKGTLLADGTIQWYAGIALPLAGGTLTGALNEAKGADIASAATTNIGVATGNYINVTGTTTITSLGTIAAGTRRIVRFTGVLTLTHNSTSLILPGAANITTAAGDVAEFVSLGSGNWQCTNYQTANLVQPIAKGGTGAIDAVNARANLGAMVAPVGGTGSNLPGEVRVTLFGSGAQPVVPAGGTWLWFTTLVFSSSALTVVGDQSYYGAGVAAGGANISTPAVGYVRTFMFWRIA